MTITALPSAPLPTDNTATFNSKAFALVAVLNTFVTEANATGVAADADAASALASKISAGLSENASVAAANYKGAYSGLTGALSIPASVSHLSKVWILTESVANVTLEVPGTSAKWLAVSVNFDSPGVIGGVTPAAASFTNFSYSGTLTGNTGIINIGAGQFYKDTSGNVGIGTSSPGSKLAVAGTVGIITGVTATAISSSNSTNTGFVLKYASNLTSLGNNFNQPLAFLTNDTERMRIDASGSLSIGTTSFVAGQNSKVIAPNVISSSVNSTAPNAHIQFYNPNGVAGQIYTDGSSTVYSTSSDYRLKENIQQMQGALDVVAQLKPVTYKWKVDGRASQGFIAHELQAVVPECVMGEKDAVDADGKPIYQGIDTSFLVATLTAAIQEQQAMIAQLQADVAALKAA